MPLNKCIVLTPVTKQLIYEFGETKIAPLLDKYFPESLPATYSDFMSKAKVDLGILTRAQVKEQLGVTLPKFISNQQLINLRKKVSDLNNKNFAKAIPVKYRTVGNFRQGQADLISWEIQRQESPLNMLGKIERIQSKIVDPQQSVTELNKLKETAAKIDEKGQTKLFNIKSGGGKDYFLGQKYFGKDLKSNSTLILDKISKTTHPLAPVAKALMPFDTGMDIFLDQVDRFPIENSEYFAAAQYNIANKNIRVAKYASFRGFGAEPTLIHEILHGLTHSYIRRYPNNSRVKALKALFEYARRFEDEMVDTYGLSSIDEFIVAIFTDAEFIEVMASKPPVGLNFKNLFEEVLNAILNLFGFTPEHKSLYNEMFATATGIIADNKAAVESLREGLRDDANMTAEDYAFFKEEPPEDLFANLSGKSFQREANAETISKIRDVLTKMGFSIQKAEALMEEYGANAIVDLANNLIRVGNARENIYLTEETLHILTNFLPPGVYEDLEDEIVKYNIYRDTLAAYGRHPLYLNPDGTTNMEKIKFEAIGKLLAEFYIKESENLSPEEVNIAKTMWERVLDWIFAIFVPNSDPFQDIINKLNTGELILTNQPMRDDMLMSMAFTDANIQEVTNSILTNPNERIIKDFSDSIRLIESEDMKVIWNNVNKISGINRDTFAASSNMAKRAANADDMKEEVLNIVSYIGATYSNSNVLREELDDITKQLENKEELTSKKILKLYNAVYHINQIATIYERELVNFENLLGIADPNEGAAVRDFRKTITETLGNIGNIKRKFTTLAKQEAATILGESYKEKSQAIIARVRMEIDVLKDRLDVARAKGNLNRETRIQSLIEKKQREIDSPVTGESLFQMLSDPTNSGIYSLWHHWLDGTLTSKNAAIQQTANLIYTEVLQSQKDALPETDQLIDLANGYFDRHGRPTDLDTAYERVTEVVHRVAFDPAVKDENGFPQDLQEWDEIRLLSEHKQWEFENDIAIEQKHKADIMHALESETDPDIIEELEKQKEAINTKLKNMYTGYGQRRYTDKYYEISAELDALLSDGVTTVRQIREIYIDEIKRLDDQITKLAADHDIDAILDEKDRAVFDLMRIESEYNMNGTRKTGDDLLVAQAITRYKARKREEEVDGSFITKSAEERWRYDKDKIDKRLESAQAQYDERPTPENEANLANVTKERNLWYRRNTKQEIPKEFFQERNEIMLTIQDILDDYKAKDTETEAELNADITEIWGEIFNITKGLKDEDGILKGTEALALSDEIRFKETEIMETRERIKEMRPRFSEADWLTLEELYSQLEEIQSTPLNKYWYVQVDAVKSKIEADLVAAGTFENSDQVDRLFYESDFFKENTIDVSKQFRKAKPEELPENVIRVGKKKTYKPIYTWRETVPNEAMYAKTDAPSFKWYTPRVNKEFENPDYLTVQGNIALDPAKAEHYRNDRWGALSVEDKNMLKEIKKIYYERQKVKGKKLREGDALPRIQATGIQRLKQRIRNAKDMDYKQFFKKETWRNIFDLNPTKLETEYGEGEREDSGNVTVMAKYSNKTMPITRQDKDIFRILTMYTIESHKYSRMWNLVPVLSSIKAQATPREEDGTRKQLGSKQTLAKIDFIIDKFVNDKSIRDTGLLRNIRQIQAFSQSSLAMQWLGFPWQQTSIIKNELQGLWQIMIMSPWLKQYSKGSVLSALRSSAAKAYSIAGRGKFQATPNKYVAVARHLNVVASLNIKDVSDTFASTTTKSVNNWRYLLGFQRTWSEVHLELAMYELFKQKFKPWGDTRTIEDMYDFVDGKLTPKKIQLVTDGVPQVDEDGLPVMVPEITPEMEAHITRSVKNMHQFTAGNYDFANSPLAKAYVMGSAVLFMKNYFYNTSQALFGGARTLSTGQEMEGAYRVFWRLLKENWRNILFATELTPSEKAGLIRFYFHTAVINLIGGAILVAQSYLNNNGEDDDDEKVLWYMTNLSRKLYFEIGYFNAFDRAATQYQIATGSRDVASPIKTKNPITRTLMYTVGNPVVDLAGNTFVFLDYKELKFDSKINTSDPYYKQFKDNVWLYDFMKFMKTHSEMGQPKNALTKFQYFNESVYDYRKPKKKKGN